MTLTDISFTSRVALAVLLHAGALVWTRFVVAPANPGSARSLRALSLVPAMFVLSALFNNSIPEEGVLKLVTIVNAMWLIPIKVCSLAMNRGQLVKCYDSGSDIAFSFAFLAPILVAFEEKAVDDNKEHEQDERRIYKDVQFDVIRLKGRAFYGEALKLVIQMATKVGITLVSKKIADLCGHSGQLFWHDACFGLMFYCATSCIQDQYCLLILLTLNLKLAPSFVSPFLSQSVQELCGRRYNIAMGEPLRDLIYDPICEGRWVRGSFYRKKRRPSLLRRSLAILLTFAVSGAGHFLLLWYGDRGRLPIKFGSFFLACGLIVIAENALKCICESSRRLSAIAAWIPAWTKILYTLGVISYLGHVMFWPDLHALNLSSGVADALLVTLGLD